MSKFLYNQNKTMELLGHQVGVYAGTDADRGIMDIIAAYTECEKDPLTQALMQVFQKGILFNFLSNVYTLGVIAGKREERKRGKRL